MAIDTSTPALAVARVRRLEVLSHDDISYAVGKGANSAS